MSNETARELDLYWMTVVNTIREGIMIVDAKGVIASVNQAFEDLIGYSREELIGRPCRVLRCDICEQVIERGASYYCRLFREGSIGLRQCVIHRKDGAPVHALKNAALLHDEQGRVIGAVESVTDISELIDKDNQIEAFRRELQQKDGLRGILGTSRAMQRVFELIQDAARSDAPVIIYGESGTGKELVSRAIHEIGERRTRPFVKINCASLSESLLESELFGHVRGAFTGAYRDRVGRFAEADEGDLFLDEIGDLPQSIQIKLLRVLEEKVIERVGDNVPVSANARLISATNKDLAALVERGRFRQDFYFRINVIPIHLPPLRDRREDIPLLADAFFRTARLKTGKPIEAVSDEAMDLMLAYSWPGNVRELKSAFEYAFVTCHEATISPGHLPAPIRARRGDPATPAFDSPRESGPAAPNGHGEAERQALLQALERAGGNQTRAAQLLGVSRVTVWNRMKRHGILSTRHFEASQG